MTTAPTSRRTSPAIMCSTLDEPSRQAPLLTVYGGKITTYRRLAEAAMARLGHFFERAPALDRADRRCRAAIFRPTVSTHRWRRRSAAGRFSPSRTRGGWCAPMARASSAFSATAQSMDDLGPRFCRRSDRRRGALSGRARMGAERRRRAVAAQQARPHGDAGRAHGARAIHCSLLAGKPAALMVYRILTAIVAICKHRFNRPDCACDRI